MSGVDIPEQVGQARRQVSVSLFGETEAVAGM